MANQDRIAAARAIALASARRGAGAAGGVIRAAAFIKLESRYGGI